MVSAQLEAAEAAHYLTAALIVPYMVYAWIQNWWSVIFWFMVVQVVGNAYPIFHMRWVRAAWHGSFRKAHSPSGLTRRSN
jgi:hypothetical protein